MEATNTYLKRVRVPQCIVCGKFGPEYEPETYEYGLCARCGAYRSKVGDNLYEIMSPIWENDASRIDALRRTSPRFQNWIRWVRKERVKNSLPWPIPNTSWR